MADQENIQREDENALNNNQRNEQNCLCTNIVVRMAR